MSDSGPESLNPFGRLGVVIAFIALCSCIFGFLWVNSGGKVPVVSSSGYLIEVDIPKAANLVYFSDVMIAGVKVGKVTDVTAKGDHAHVVMEIDGGVAPIHQGATVQVRAKSLVEETFLEIADGKGQALGSGTTLPEGSGRAATQLSDVLETFDQPTRRQLRRTVRSLGLATTDTKYAVDQAVVGLGLLGTDGRDVVDAIADQSADLKELTRNSARVLASLNTRRVQLRSLIADADTITSVTAGQSADVRAVMRALPQLMSTARGSSDDLERLSVVLTPVADNLSMSAADLTAALRELPATTASLRSLLPALDGVLDHAPDTLRRVPQLSTDLEALLPDAEDVLADANPMLSYMTPYRRDLAAFFTNFAQTLALGDVNGMAFRVMPTMEDQSFKGYPLSTNIGPLNKFNPLPAPNSLQDPGVWDGTYPRVTRQD